MGAFLAANGRAHRPTCKRAPAGAVRVDEDDPALSQLQVAQCCRPQLPVDVDLAPIQRAVLAELRQLRESIERVDQERDAMYARRTALFMQARTGDTPVFYDRIGDAAGCTDAAVIQAIRREQKASS